jgi:CBS domain-containing protein
MENQPRDESRAATVRDGGTESWSEAGEFIDQPSRMPTAAGSRTPTNLPTRDSPPGSAGGYQPTTGQRDARSPGGSDFSSSAAPIGQGSNTPVGDEPDSFQSWDAQQPAPGMADDRQGMVPMLSAAGGLIAAIVAAGLGYGWWRRRQARRSRYARLQRLLMSTGLSMGKDVPRMLGKAAAQSRSPWLPFLMVPIALWLRERGRAGAQASEQLLEPLNLDRRSQRLARQGGDLLEDYSRRWVRQVDPNARRSGWGWTPLLLTGASAGGSYLAYRQGWLRWPSGAATSNGHSDATLVSAVMSSDVKTVSPDTKVVEAARQMRDLDVGSLPVTNGRRLIGMVTDRDLTVRAAANGKDPSTTPVREVMSPEVAWVFEHEPAAMAASVMRRRQIRRLPVLDRSDRLVGMVSLADLATDLGDDRLKGETLEDISQPNGSSRR